MENAEINQDTSKQACQNFSSYFGQNKLFRLKKYILSKRCFYGERKRVKWVLQFWQAVKGSEKANKYNNIAVQQKRATN